MRKVALVVLVLLIGMFLIGCGGGSGSSSAAKSVQTEPSGPVHFISPYDQSKVKLYEMFDKFKQEHPKITLDISVITSSVEINKQLMILAASSSLPDVVSVDGLFVQSFAAMGVLEDITDRVNNDLGFSPDLFYPESLSANMLNGKYYGLPFTTNCLAIFYNKKMLADNGIAEPKPDWTWDDFAAIAQKTTRPKEGIYGAVIAGTGDENGTFHFYPWFWSAGGDSYKPDSDAGRDVFSFLRKLIDNQAMSKEIMNYVQNDAAAQFSGGKAALLAAGCWQLASFQKNIKDFEFGLVNYPVNPKTGVYKTALGGRSYNIIKGGNVDAAWEFVKWMSSAEVTSYFNPPENYIPARKDVAESIPYYTDADSPMSVYRAGMDNAVMRGPHYFWIDIDAAYQTLIQQVYSGMDINAALKEAQGKIDKVVSK
jgi:multiple sugar transport system substrate-binding protein